MSVLTGHNNPDKNIVDNATLELLGLSSEELDTRQSTSTCLA